MREPCPLYRRKRTFLGCGTMSAKGRKRTSAACGPQEPLKLARSTGTVGECKRFANGLWRSAPRGYDQKMTSQNVHANAKRLVKALIDRANLDAPDGRINQVAAQTGLKENEIGPAIKYAKAQGWFQPTKIGNLKRGGWLSVTPAGKAAVES
jgi:hypothetical protein